MSYTSSKEARPTGAPSQSSDVEGLKPKATGHPGGFWCSWDTGGRGQGPLVATLAHHSTSCKGLNTSRKHILCLSFADVIRRRVLMKRRSDRILGVLLLVLGMAVPFRSNGIHFVGANVSYQWVGSNFYKLSVDLWTSCATLAIPTTNQVLLLKNSCGVDSLPIVEFTQEITEEVSPLCASQISQSTCSGGTLPGYKHWRFTTNSAVWLSPCNYWRISWSVCCREFSENLISQPGLFAEATLNNLGGVHDNSPRFAANDLPFVCAGSEVSSSPGVYDPDGNPMHFSLMNARFYWEDAVQYKPGFSGAQPIPGISIDALTGTVWFSTAVTGRYAVTIKVNSYNAVTGQLIGSVMRDLFYFVTVCDNAPPIPAPAITITGSVAASGTHSVALCNGQSFCADLVISDAQNATPLTVTSNASSILPGATFTVTGTNPVTGRLCWTANTALLPTSVFINIDDGACPISNQASSSIFLGNCALLPVDLLGFAATPENSAVVIRWSTAGEMGSDYFSVERSKEGVLFTEIGRIAGNGVINGLSDYALQDDYPLTGTSYYRLRQVDQDGEVTFGPTVPVQFGSERSSVHAVRRGSNGWSVLGLDSDAELALTDALGRMFNLKLPDSIDQGVWIESTSSDQMMILIVLDRGGRQVLRLPPVASDGTVIAARGSE